MNLVHKFLMAGLTAVVFANAQEVSIRNVCDTLTLSENPQVTLKLAYVDETRWFGDKALKKADSSFVTRFADYTQLKPQHDYFEDKLPYSVTAECRETSDNLYAYGVWSKPSTKWNLNDDNNDYATYIMDIHGNKMPGYDSTNTYNILAVKQGGMPEDGQFASGELLVSKSFEFKFDWWFASIAYRITSTRTEINGKDTTTYISGTNKYSSSMGMDSLAVVQAALSALTLPDTLTKVKLQVFHAVLMDERKITADVIASSSSEDDKPSSSQSGSSEDVKSSSSSAGNESSEKGSSGNEPSGEKVDGSSSSTTAIGELRAAARMQNETRQVRRLNGTVVLESESLVPGIYYVKDARGVWKKQMVLPH